MRFYSFTNMYLSSLQVGLQSGHCIADMFVRYPNGLKPASKDQMLWEWAEEHKTMILLNGGYDSAIRDLTEFFERASNPYPWSDFHESEDAMNNMQTTVGIILPERIYEGAAIVRTRRRGWEDVTQVLHPDGTRTILQPTTAMVSSPKYWEFTEWEVELIDRINSFGLAR